MPGIMMNSYSSSSRKTLKRSCCIRSKTLLTNSSRSTRAPSSYFSSSLNSNLSTASSISSTSSHGTNSVSSLAPSSGSSTPRFAENTRLLDRYFARTNKEQRKSDEWGHFVHI
mmetsp:Transcript_53741/g.60025  ORF Transcript_53741/g.60025 Transcript_53741/m.60025 type:complete len:113 (-) Transcript_53741:188-526(-)